MNKSTSNRIFGLCLVLFTCSCAHTKSVVTIRPTAKSIGEREAILIISGLGSKMFGNRAQEKYFDANGASYDIFIPDYISRASIDRSVFNLEKFVVENNIPAYRKVHVFSYILGSWVINKYIVAHPENNISTIIYDRSPAQERAPYALVNDMPILIKMISGKVMRDLANTPYQSIEKKNIKIGIIIESKATNLLIKHKTTALKNYELKWDVASLNQVCDDYMYTWLNHDQMYSRFDVIGEELFSFIRNGKFSSTAQRRPYDWDPFEIYIEKK